MMVMRALLDGGMAIPGDSAIVGCDNLPICDFLRPRLTSIWPALSEAGCVVANYIHDLIEGRNPTVDQALVKSKLVIRESD